MTHKTDRLLFKFAIMFLIFTVVTLFISSINTYVNQTDSYKQQAEVSLKEVAHCLRQMLVADGENFLQFQNYFLENHDKILVRKDFSGDFLPEKENFEKLFSEKYPGKVFGADIKFDDMPDEIKIAYAKYYFEYWLGTFERTREAFQNVGYTYYIVPGKEKLHMVWMLDAIREPVTIDGVEYITLCIDVEEPLEEHQKMWTAWESGKEPDGYDTYDNEFGRTYAYYTPLNIDGKIVGVIGTEVEIERVNNEILRLTLKQTAGMGMILFLCVLALLGYIHQKYISKLSHLQLNVREYSQNKNPAVVKNIESEVEGQDEIASLSMQIAAMILELENYMKHLIKVAKELSNTKEKALEMHELAHTDALTGVNNKNAYDKLMRQLDWKIEDGVAEFAIAMIDLNFLKRINDTYGHENGNVAIKKLCSLVQDIFLTSPIFRIGGDEFVVVIQGEDYRDIDELIEEFNQKLEEIANDNTLEPWEKTSAAIGVAIYDRTIDSSSANVFKRADKAMYIRKKEMNAVRTS